MGKQAPAWPQALLAPDLPPGEVHLWRVELEQAGDQQRLWEVLSDRERAQAGRLRFALHRGRYVVSRGLLRVVLGRYLGLAPEKVHYRYGPRGKPTIEAAGTPPLHFNASDSGRLAVFAVARAGECGVDLERARADFPALEVARRFFSPAEVTGLEALGTRRQREAFFACWTCKEAYLKATGEGISGRLREAAFWPLASLGAPLACHCDPAWSLYRFVPAPGYLGALVVKGQGWQVRTWELPQASPLTVKAAGPAPAHIPGSRPSAGEW